MIHFEYGQLPGMFAFIGEIPAFSRKLLHTYLTVDHRELFKTGVDVYIYGRQPYFSFQDNVLNFWCVRFHLYYKKQAWALEGLLKIELCKFMGLV